AWSSFGCGYVDTLANMRVVVGRAARALGQRAGASPGHPLRQLRLDGGLVAFGGWDDVLDVFGVGLGRLQRSLASAFWECHSSPQPFMGPGGRKNSRSARAYRVPHAPRGAAEKVFWH